MTEPIFFASPEEFRAWLEQHHATEPEVFVGFWRKATGMPTMTWSDAVDEALCYGWIDSVNRRVDDDRRAQRFSPRRPGSNWSAVNIAKVERLRAEGRMRPAGEAAFARRREDPAASYSYERRYEAAFEPDHEQRFRANAAAWEYWSAAPRGYRAMATWWVVSAKRPETRERRLGQLIEDSAAGRRLKQLTS